MSGITRATSEVVFGTTVGTSCEGSDVRLEAQSSGFVNRTDSAISIAGSTFTITGVNFVIWPTLITKMLKSTESIAITNVVGLHWIFYSFAGVLTCTPPASGFPGFDKCLVANVYWDGAQVVFLGDERHGNVMDTATHEYGHKTFGARYVSGFAVTKLSSLIDGALPASAQIVVDAGNFVDEDIEFAVTRGSLGVAGTQELGLIAGAVPAQIPVYYRTGVGGTWTKDVATTYPMKPSGALGSTRVGYNKDTGGTWSVADPVVNGAIVAYWIVATNDRYEPVVAIMGQRFDATGNTAAILLAAQTNNTFASLSQGNLPFAEMKVLYRLLVKTDLNYNNNINAAIQVLTASDDYRSVAAIPSGNYVSSAHASLAGRSDPNQHPDSSITTTPSVLIGGLTSTDLAAVLLEVTARTRDRGKWWNCGVVPTTTAVSTSSVTCMNLGVKPGDPIRIVDKTGLYFTLTTPNITGSALTGLTGTLLDHRGNMYAKSFAITATSYRYDIYSDEPCLYQIGTTSAFDASATATNTLTVTAVNGSGLGGTMTAVSAAGGRTADIVHRISYVRKGICTAYVPASGLLTFAGQPVTLTAGSILEVWLGDSRLVVQYPIDIDGSFATADTNTAFLTKQLRTPHWTLGGAVLCQVLARNNTADSGASQAKVALIINGTQTVVDGSALTLSSDAAPLTTLVELNPLLLDISYTNSIELRVLKGTNGDARDLEGNAVFVLN